MKSHLDQLIGGSWRVEDNDQKEEELEPIHRAWKIEPKTQEEIQQTKIRRQLEVATQLKINRKRKNKKPDKLRSTANKKKKKRNELRSTANKKKPNKRRSKVKKEPNNKLKLNAN